MTALSFLAAAAECPTRVALVVDGIPHTFAALAPRVHAACDRFRGRTHVPVIARADLDTAITLYALIELGVPALLIHPRLTDREKGDGFKYVSFSASDPAPLAILFTSGTTGRPRGAMLSRAAFLAAADASAANLGWRDDDRWLLAMPPAHVGGLSILTRCLIARRTVVIGDPHVATARDRVTILSLVPTQLVRLLDAGWLPPAHVRAILLGGAATSPALFARARSLGLPILVTYGCTEACSQIATQIATQPALATQPAPPRAPLLLPVRGMSVRIADDHHIHIRGPNLFSGYLDGLPHLTPDGWFDTGDLGELDPHTGALTILARRTDLIVTGGENVYPAEVEAVLEACPGVTAACVFGVPDPTWGQIVAAAVVPAPPPPLAAHAAAQLASFKRPRLYFPLASLPVTPAGKLDRAAVAQRFANR